MTPAAAPQFAIESSAPDTLVVSGALRFGNATQALQNLVAASPAGRMMTLDMARVESVDSAGLACVLAWMAKMQAAGGRGCVQAVPAALMALARVSEVDHLFCPG